MCHVCCIYWYSPYILILTSRRQSSVLTVHWRLLVLTRSLLFSVCDIYAWYTAFVVYTGVFCICRICSVSRCLFVFSLCTGTHWYSIHRYSLAFTIHRYSLIFFRTPSIHQYLSAFFCIPTMYRYSSVFSTSSMYPLVSAIYSPLSACWYPSALTVHSTHCTLVLMIYPVLYTLNRSISCILCCYSLFSFPAHWY